MGFWGGVAQVGGALLGNALDSKQDDTLRGSNLPPWAHPYYRDTLHRSRILADRPYTPYGGQRVAGLSNNEMLAGALARSRAGQWGYAPSYSSYYAPSGSRSALAYQGGNQGGALGYGGAYPIAQFGTVTGDAMNPGYESPINTRLLRDEAEGVYPWNWHNLEDTTEKLKFDLGLKGFEAAGSWLKEMFDQPSINWNLPDTSQYWRQPSNGMAGNQASYGNEIRYQPDGTMSVQPYMDGGTWIPPAPDYLGESAAYTRAGALPFTTADMAAYMNPFAKAALDPAARELGRAFENERNRSRDMAVSRGAFGGSRGALLESENQRNYMRGLGDLYSEGLARAFDTATGLWRDDQGRLMSAGRDFRGLADSDARIAKDTFDMLMRQGGLDRLTRQADLDFFYDQFIEGRDWQKNNLQQYISAVHGLDPGSYTPPPNRAGQTIGALASAFGEFMEDDSDGKDD